MAHKGKLVIGSPEREYIIIECSYTLTQRMTYNVQPAEKPRAGEIELTTVAPDDTDMFFHRWMHSPTGDMEGKITLQVVANNEIVERVLNFKGYCISLYEYFNMQNTDQMHLRITIATTQISFGGDGDEAVVFKNDRGVNESSD